MTCANFRNQEAINAAIQKANQTLIALDESYGIESPRPIYEVGTILCDQCADAGNPDLLKDMFDEVQRRDSKFHRICFREA